VAHADALAEVPPELCAITGAIAHFRDPKSGLAYANSYAYKEIQKLLAGGSRWSDLLGCYVGPARSAARGVPEGFVKP
jgi:vacuolar protein sorting-associated protein 72